MTTQAITNSRQTQLLSVDAVHQLSTKLTLHIFSFLPSEFSQCGKGLSKELGKKILSILASQNQVCRVSSFPDALTEHVFSFLNPLEFTEDIRLVSKNWLKIAKHPRAVKQQLAVCSSHIVYAERIQSMQLLSTISADTCKSKIDSFFAAGNSIDLKKFFCLRVCTKLIDMDMFQQVSGISDDNQIIASKSFIDLLMFDSGNFDSGGRALCARIIHDTATGCLAEFVQRMKFSASYPRLNFICDLLEGDSVDPYGKRDADEEPFSDPDLVSVSSSIERAIPASKRAGEMSESEDLEVDRSFESDDEDGLIVSEELR